MNRLLLVILIAVTLFGCQRADVATVPPETVPPEIALQPFKVGLLQPPGYYPSFTKGAELARDEINAERVVRDRKRRDTAAYICFWRDNGGIRFLHLALGSGV